MSHTSGGRTEVRIGITLPIIEAFGDVAAATDDPPQDTRTR
jgi:hypothetical protein